MLTKLENYVKHVKFEPLLKKLGAFDPETLAKEVEHFTTKEAKQRDKIVINYFGKTGVDRIVNTVAIVLLEPPRLSANANILDVGSGTGSFTVKIAMKIRAKAPKVSFYAMDMTPAMLFSLIEKNANITPFIGIAENIKASAKEARKYFNIPYKFDAVFSTLMLHHSVQPGKVFRSIRTVLKKKGKAIVVDLCKHSFKEFKTEMGDLHLGFRLETVHEMAQKYFSKVKVEKMSGICCECSGHSAEIFVALMHD